MKGISRKIRPGIIGLLIAGLLGLGVIYFDYKSNEIIDRIISGQWCGVTKDPTPACLQHKENLPSYEREDEINEILLEGFAVASGGVAALSGLFIAFVLLRHGFSIYVAPISKKLRSGYEISRAADKIEKYQKLLDSGVLTQEQYDSKIKELKKLVSD